MKTLFLSFIFKSSVVKKIGSALSITLLVLNSYAQAPDWLWAAASSGNYYDFPYGGISTDANGNVYVTGGFASDSITFGTITLLNASDNTYEDMFIVKYDASGNVIWAQSAGGAQHDRGLGIATDDAGDIYVTGDFYSTSITFGTFTLIKANTDDIFIVKYDPLGNVLWAKSAGGTYSESGNGITTDNNGNIYITGEFADSTITFGTTTLTNINPPYKDIFVVKCSGSGNMIWAKSAGGPGTDEGKNISIDGLGNVYVSGTFYNAPITFDTTTLTNSGSYDLFFVKYDAAGNLLWAKSAGGTDADDPNDIATDASGNIYLTGYFYSTSITFETTTLTNIGLNTNDIFIVKYDGAGNVLWAQSAGGGGWDGGTGVATDAGGNLYLTGYFEGPVYFGTAFLSSLANSLDIFIVKYDASGNVSWAKAVGSNGINDDEGLSVSLDPDGNVYVTGYFDVPSITFGTTTFFNSFGFDVFVAKLASTLTGTAEVSENDAVNVYPNPASDNLYVTGCSSSGAAIEIYNVPGEKVYSTQLSATDKSNLAIDVSKLVGGTYFLRIQTKDFTEVKKIVVAK